MRLEFIKMHGCGNDFVMLDDWDRTLPLSEDLVHFLCDRHFGIGADGVIAVQGSDDPDCTGYMHYFNADGTLAEMCGNGIRCTARYLVDHGRTGSDHFTIDTLSGPKPVVLARRDDEFACTIDMGAPILKRELIPTLLADVDDGSYGRIVIEQPIQTPFGDLRFTCVSMGNPHAVTFIDDVRGLDINPIGSFLEPHGMFPEKSNIEFARVLEVDRDGWSDIEMRVFERGVGETLACGTGCCATLVAASLTGRTGRRAHLHILGGVLDIEWAGSGTVMMTGPASISFTGSIEVPDSLTRR